MQFHHISNQYETTETKFTINHLIEMKSSINKGFIGLIIIVFSSFVFDIWALTKYPLSYGIDGPFYNIHVNMIFATGFPNSNDPPLVYYLMAFFSIFFGVTLGIKVAMALFSSLIAVPTYYITKMYIETFDKKTVVPALVSSFLMVFNIYYLTLIGDFMQNLVGVFFLLCFVYYLLKWISKEKLLINSDLIIMSILFLLNTITHIYTAGLTIFLLSMSLVFKLFVNYKTTGAFPSRELKILGGLTISIITLTIGLFVLFPGMTSDFLKIESFLATFLDSNSGSFQSIMFLTVPFVIGLLFVMKHINFKNLTRLFISFNLLILSCLLFILSLPFIASEWQTRFMLLNFLPISIVSSIGIFSLYFFNLKDKLSIIQGINIKKILILCISIIFILTSFISTVNFVATMGPTITENQYQELTTIKSEYYGSTIKAGDVIILNNAQDNYWVSLVFNKNRVIGLVKTQGLSLTNENYFVFDSLSSSSPFSNLRGQYWNPFLPFGLFTNSNKNSGFNGPLTNQRPQNAGPNQPINNQSPQNTGNSFPALNQYPTAIIFQGTYYSVYQIT